MEVKAGGNLQDRRFKVYGEKYETQLAIRASLSNFKFDEGLLNVPLHMLWNLENYLNLINVEKDFA